MTFSSAAGEFSGLFFILNADEIAAGFRNFRKSGNFRWRRRSRLEDLFAMLVVHGFYSSPTVGKNKGVSLGELGEKSLLWYVQEFEVSYEYNGKPKKPETIAKDEAFRAALDEAAEDTWPDGLPE